MAIKTRAELTSELPINIKSYGVVSAQKTTGDSLKSMIQDIIDSMSFVNETLPIGSIVAWSGSIATIPTHWCLCDGLNGSPDLRDKFIMGAGGAHALGVPGGSETHSHTGTVQGHALTINEIPSHNHGLGLSTGGANSDGGNDFVKTSTTGTTFSTKFEGGGSSHSHGLTINDGTNLPPHIPLAYIMYKGLSYVLVIGTPTGLIASNVTSATVDLSWSAPIGGTTVTSYGVYKNGVFLHQVTAPTLNYTVTGLTANTAYTFEVKAADAGGFVSPSSNVEGITTDQYSISVDYYTDPNLYFTLSPGFAPASVTYEYSDVSSTGPWFNASGPYTSPINIGSVTADKWVRISDTSNPAIMSNVLFIPTPVVLPNIDFNGMTTYIDSYTSLPISGTITVNSLPASMILRVDKGDSTSDVYGLIEIIELAPGYFNGTSYGTIVNTYISFTATGTYTVPNYTASMDFGSTASIELIVL